MKKIYYILAGLVVLMIALNILEINSFKTTKEKIKNDIFNELLKNVENTTKNISSYINKTYSISKLKNNENIKNKIDSYLNSFITNNYKNLFLVSPIPNSKFFIALADGSKVDKFDFKEKFEPLNKKYWKQVLTTKKPIYFKQKIKDIWMTFLYPVISHNKIDYIIVIDFSTKPLRLVTNNLNIFKKNVTIFSIVIFISIIILIIFLVYDYKRQAQMKKLLKDLQELNDTLEERVQTELAKNEAKDKQLILQSRLALMGELLSMIAHQWRQPLNTIGGIISNIKLDIALDELNTQTIEETIKKIEKIILHLSHTIDDFSDFYKNYDEKHLEEVSLFKLIKESLHIISYSLTTNNIKLSLDKADNNIKILTMPSRLKQVLLNIIKNAIDALVENKIENPHIYLSTFKENNNIIIKIKDNANGIPQEIIDKIFDPYFTTKHKKNGTGIGLYMSKMIIEKLNGNIFVYNDNNGAVFRIELKDLNGN